MKVPATRNEFGGVTGVAMVAALAATLAVTPPDPMRPNELTPRIHAIQLQAVTAGAVFNGAAARPSAEAGPAASAPAGPRSNTSASASGSPNLFAVVTAIGLGSLLLPLWYLSFPVTLPMTILFIGALGGVCSGCFSGSSRGMSNPLAYIILPGIQFWLTGPITGIFNLLSPGSASAATVGISSAAVVAPAVRRKALSAKGVGRSDTAAPARTPARTAGARSAADTGPRNRAEKAAGKRAAIAKR